MMIDEAIATIECFLRESDNECKNMYCELASPFCKFQRETAMETVIDALRSHRWVSVDDRLPQDGERVLSVQEDGVVRINMAHGRVFDKIINRRCELVKTTHWMPLPELPGGET